MLYYIMIGSTSVLVYKLLYYIMIGSTSVLVYKLLYYKYYIMIGITSVLVYKLLYYKYYITNQLPGPASIVFISWPEDNSHILISPSNPLDATTENEKEICKSLILSVISH